MSRFTPRVGIISDNHGSWSAEGFPGLYHAERVWKKLSLFHASVLFLETSSGGWCALREYGTATAVRRIKQVFASKYKDELFPEIEVHDVFESRAQPPSPPPPPPRRASGPAAESARDAPRPDAPTLRRSSIQQAPRRTPTSPAPPDAPTNQRASYNEDEIAPAIPYAAQTPDSPTLRRSSMRDEEPETDPTRAPPDAPTNQRASYNEDEIAPAIPYAAPTPDSPTLRRSSIRDEASTKHPTRRASEPTEAIYRSQETDKPTLRRASYTLPPHLAASLAIDPNADGVDDNDAA